MKSSKKSDALCTLYDLTNKQYIFMFDGENSICSMKDKILSLQDELYSEDVRADIVLTLVANALYTQGLSDKKPSYNYNIYTDTYEKH